MDITWRKSASGHYIAEVWSDPVKKLSGTDRTVPLDEDTYVEMNTWCAKNFNYNSRSAYHVFEFKKESDLNWFLLRYG